MKHLMGILLAAAMSATPAVAESSWRTLAQFDDAPEGLVSDGQGGLFVSLFQSGKIIQVDAKGNSSTIGDVRDVVGDAEGSFIGIDWDKDDTIYVAFAQHSHRYPWPTDLSVAHQACADSTVLKTGIYAVSVSTGNVSPVATRAEGYAFCYPDEPAVAPDGTLYVSDLSLSGIWHIDPASGEATLWSKDALLQPGNDPMSGFSAGVNGITLSKEGDAIYGVTGGNPMLVRIPINDDGSAGPAKRIAYGYDNMDGLEIGPDGNFYVTEAIRHEVWQISPDISNRQQLGNPLDAPLGSPASIAFMGNEVCVTNLNFFGNLPPEKANTIVCVGDIPKKW